MEEEENLEGGESPGGQRVQSPVPRRSYHSAAPL